MMAQNRFRLLLQVALICISILSLDAQQYYGSYYCQPGRDVVVHLFEWKWTDIERECTWLAENNFCAVQVR